MASISVAAFTGLVAESVAYTLRLWRYHRSYYPVINILLMFGLVNGSVAWLFSPSTLVTFIVGWLVGLCYELANFKWLNWWYFPNNQFLIFEGVINCSLSVAVLWGATPVFVQCVVNGGI